MKDAFYYLETEREKGRSDERLRRAAARFTGLAPGDPQLALSRTEHGKPFFPMLPLHCSVTHSGGIWLCALSPSPVGVDLQRHQKCDGEKIALRYFRPEEADWLVRHPDRFFDLWCIKESYAKYTGAGIVPGLDVFPALEGETLTRHANGVPLRLIPFRPGYSLCLCGGTGGEPALTELPSD